MGVSAAGIVQAPRAHAFEKCQGIDCERKYRCERFTALPVKNQRWASFYALEECEAFVEVVQ